MENYKYDFAVVGGDLRQAYMAELLAEKNFSVILYETQQHPQCEGFPFAGSLMEAIKSAKTIIAPIPLTREGKKIYAKNEQSDLTVCELKNQLQKGQKLFAGCISEELCQWGIENQVDMYDFMENEELTLYNTIATAEGTIAEAIIRHPVNLHRSKSLVIGYGRCAKVLAQGLHGLCSQVSVCARKPSARSEAQVAGHQAISFLMLKEKINEYDFIFNTVPSLVLDKSILSHVKPEGIIIDIASAPGGVDYQAAEQLGIKAYLCLGLPGKYAPKSSAEALVQVLLSNSEWNDK
ncbi:MAG: dipicolinate synthase subunit DpsA [Epulopiscium sp.]|jgi:dipicolinate synthase subunit A|nr:dipicolinate synthase subunit DpsA [Candidatus Epulonipiscium sp.]